MAGQKEIEIATKLFEAWSSGDADAPAQYLTEDCVLRDIVAGEDKVGWPAIREFFAAGLVGAPDLILIPDEFWVNDDGVAFTWDMSATITHEMFGAENKGKKWQSPGMTYLEFRGDKVSLEVDYHHGGNPARSVGFTPG
ncbi:MAG TPA: nuclear transport factor 2 family protein [Dehalococcoidia bacterium]|nr:nuclear transport factor 2 family protein [Dehalococcoidia bacterium]